MDKIKEQIDKAFEKYDIKMQELKRVGNLLSDYCKGIINNFEFQKEGNKLKLKEELEKYWKNTKEKRKRTHSGKMYDKLKDNLKLK